jgi:cytochrome c oxidase subunit 1
MMANTIDRRDAKLGLTHILIGFAAVFVGALMGLLQGLVRGGLIELPSWLNYYQILLLTLFSDSFMAV